MDDEDEMDLTGTFVPDSELKRKLNTLRTIAQPEQETVAPETLQATARMKYVETNASTSATRVLEARAMLKKITESPAQHHYQRKAAHVSWVQRLLGWFRRN